MDLYCKKCGGELRPAEFGFGLCYFCMPQTQHECAWCYRKAPIGRKIVHRDDCPVEGVWKDQDIMKSSTFKDEELDIRP